MNKYLKIISYILLTVFLISFSACSKSTNLIEGEWKAQTGAMKNEIVKFDNDKMTVNGKEYNFNIKSIEKKDDVIYYKIEKDGELFTVLFLFKEDRNIAYMLQPYTSDNLTEGKVIYNMRKVSNKN